MRQLDKVELTVKEKYEKEVHWRLCSRGRFRFHEGTDEVEMFMEWMDGCGGEEGGGRGGEEGRRGSPSWLTVSDWH